MKFCVFGAGAIGGYLAVTLAVAGHEVSVIARGAHLKAIQKNGLKLLIGGEEKIARTAAAEDPQALGPQDFVICSLKAHQAYDAAASFAPLLSPHTAVLTAMNGIPWWYFYKAGDGLNEHHLKSVDPAGKQWNLIGPQRAIGCVVDPACEVIAPGVIEHLRFNRFWIGEPNGTRSTRVTELAAALVDSGFDAPVQDNIRWNIWLKLWGNVCFNPISILTGMTLDRIIHQPDIRALCKKMMHETKAVNEALGIHIPDKMIDRRLEAAGSVMGHKMSMLQDLERGRSLEIDAIVTVVQELGQLTGISTPTVDMMLALAQERGRSAGLYTPMVS